MLKYTDETLGGVKSHSQSDIPHRLTGLYQQKLCLLKTVPVQVVEKSRRLVFGKNPGKIGGRKPQLPADAFKRQAAVAIARPDQFFCLLHPGMCFFISLLFPITGTSFQKAAYQLDSRVLRPELIKLFHPLLQVRPRLKPEYI